MAKRLIVKHLRYAVEGAMVAALFVLFRIMPLPLASGLAGALAGTVGPLLPLHARARRNLHRAMPELPPVEVERALGEMWQRMQCKEGQSHSIKSLRTNAPK